MKYIYPKPKVGDEIFIDNRYTGLVKETVTKVGNKYFYIGYDQYTLSAWRLFYDGYMRDQHAYPSIQAHEESKKCKRWISRFMAIFSYTHAQNYTLKQYQEAARILNIKLDK